MKLLGFLFSLVLLASPTLGEDTPKLHILLVNDTDSNLTEWVNRDRDDLIGIFKEAFGESRLSITVFDGADVNNDTVLATIRDRMPTGPADTLMFLYNGHGGFASETEHNFTTSHGTIHRSDVKAAMQAKTARLKLLISSCCSNYYNADAGYGAGEVNKQAMEDLFFESRGFVDFTAATRGQLAWSGFLVGAMTMQLHQSMETLDGTGDGFVGWLEYFYAIKADVATRFKNLHDTWTPDHEYYNTAPQVPMYWEIGENEQTLFTSNYRNKFVLPWASYQLISGQKWGRFNPQGQFIANVDFVSSNAQEVRLNENPPGNLIVLQERDAWVMSVGSTEFTKFAEGRWQRPRFTNRAQWFHANGRFELQSGLDWNEYDNNGTVLATFKLNGYGKNGIELLDANRNLYVRLGTGNAQWKIGIEGVLQNLYPGNFGQ